MDFNRKMDHVAILEISAELIEKCGWMRGSYGNPLQGYCVEGAMIEATRYTVDHHYVPKAHMAAIMAFSRHTGTTRPAVYNDELGRTKEECVAALRACAAIERAKGDTDPAAEPVAKITPQEYMEFITITPLKPVPQTVVGPTPIKNVMARIAASVYAGMHP